MFLNENIFKRQLVASITHLMGLSVCLVRLSVFKKNLAWAVFNKSGLGSLQKTILE